jgi:invasion protein IalB
MALPLRLASEATEVSMNYLISRVFAVTVLAGLAITSTTAEEADLRTLDYTSWAKYCLKEICLVGSEGRSNPDCGPVVRAVVIEPFGEPKKISLHVTLPSWVNSARGVRIVIDQGEPIERPYVGCLADGCRAEYEAGAELVDQFKHGRILTLEAVDKANSPIIATVPLIGFDNAYDGASQEPKVFFETSQKKLQMELDERKTRCETGK